MKKKNKHAKEQQIEKVNKHFVKTPKKPSYVFAIILILLGAGALIFGVNNGRSEIGDGSSVVGLVLVLVGFLIFISKWSTYKSLYKKAEPKYSDDEMDRLLKEGKEQVISNARERLDIDIEDTRSALIIDGPENNTVMGYGEDKMLRFRYHNILVLFLTDHNIASYHCTLDLGCSEILQDKTKEFPYKDITNLETETTNDVFYYSDKKKLNVEGIKKFSIHTSGGNASSVNYIFSDDATDKDGKKLPPSDIDKTMNAIRKKLKEYNDRPPLR